MHPAGARSRLVYQARELRRDPFRRPSSCSHETLLPQHPHGANWMPFSPHATGWLRRYAEIGGNAPSYRHLLDCAFNLRPRLFVVGFSNGKLVSRKERAGASRSRPIRPGTSARRSIPYGRRQPAGSRIGTHRSGHLGRGLHELSRCVAGIESAESANPSGRQAVVSDDSRKAARAPRAGRPYSYSTSTRSRIPPPACVARVGPLDGS
jgi:hypothetical protein